MRVIPGMFPTTPREAGNVSLAYWPESHLCHLLSARLGPSPLSSLSPPPARSPWNSLHCYHLPNRAPRVLIYPVNQLVGARHLALVLAQPVTQFFVGFWTSRSSQRLAQLDGGLRIGARHGYRRDYQRGKLSRGECESGRKRVGCPNNAPNASRNGSIPSSVSVSCEVTGSTMPSHMSGSRTS